MTYRVLTGQISHETNTFSKLPTDTEAYRTRALYTRDEVPERMRGTNSEVGAVLDVAEKYGWDLLHPVVGNATPSGKVTKDAWEMLCHFIIDACGFDGPFDGVVLALHGAMVTETTDDGEGELLQRIRDRIGPDVPMVATLDLHANVTERMAANANVLVTYRTYPHVDMYDRGEQAAELLQRMMTGEVGKLETVLARREQLDGFDHGRTTFEGPMTEALRRARAFEQEPGIHVVSVNGGFPWADIEEAGPSVTVSHEDQPDRAAEIAQEIADYGWETRADRTIEHWSPEDALTHVKQAGGGDKPFVLADFSDNPGGGSYGDSPALLQAMVEAGLENAAFALISDPEVAAAGLEAGIGAEISMPLGGKFDPSVTPAFEMTGTVNAVSETGDFIFEGPMFKGLPISMGPAILLQIGGVETVVCTNRLQVFDREFFRLFGVVVENKSVVAVKSAQHFRAVYQPLAREVLLVDAAGITSPDPKKFEFKKLRRPIWPLDMD